MAGQILIVDGLASNRITLSSLISAARYDVDATGSAGEALARLETERPDLILCDADAALSGPCPLLPALRAGGPAGHVPLIALCAENDPTTRIAALRAGADDVTAKSGAHRTLLARVRSQLRSADAAQALAHRQATVRDLGLGFAESATAFDRPDRIVLIAHDPARARIWRDLLAPFGCKAVSAMGIDDAMADVGRGTSADLFVIEAALAHPGEALGLLADLRARPATRHAAIIVVHDPADGETATMALDLGASDLICAGFAPEELALRLRFQLDRKHTRDRLRASVDEGLRLAVLDPLTGLFNRRYAEGHARRVAAENGDRGGFCVILADLDRFKTVNDSYGHAAGDAVLVEVARRLRDNVRAVDMVARIGGEEFLIYLPDPDAGAAEAAAHRLCAVVRDTPIPAGRANPELSVTASFGVAMGAAGDTLEHTIARADKALYEAKAGGRDMVSLAAHRAA